MNGTNPLDASAVHPEAYPLVEKILTDKKMTITQVIGNQDLLKHVNAADYVNEHFGLPTVQDVLRELEKPGRDPRPEFKTVNFKEGIEDINHLEEGMILEGVVSNVTNFGAFVDIGVHQDGLVHISAMTNRFITDPHTVVKAGDIVKVKVVEVDKARRRIGLSMKLDDARPAVVQKKVSKPAPAKKAPGAKKDDTRKRDDKRQVQPAKKGVFNTAMADALSKLKRGS